MDEKQLYASILGLTDPWKVERVDLRLDQGEIRVFVAMPKKMRWVCPECLREAPIHDHKERQWRHLDTCQYRTILQARVPRLNCPTHGVKQVKVPWAELELPRFRGRSGAFVFRQPLALRDSRQDSRSSGRGRGKSTSQDRAGATISSVSDA